MSLLSPLLQPCEPPPHYNKIRILKFKTAFLSSCEIIGDSLKLLILRLGCSEHHSFYWPNSVLQ